MAKRNAASGRSAPNKGARAAGKPARGQPAAPPRRRGRVVAVMLSLLAVLLLVLGLIWAFTPRENGRFDPPPVADLPENLDSWLYAEESGIRPDVARRIVWGGRPGVKTPVALIYLHGFSATSQELRPVPDLIAAWRGANLYFARLTGHGMDGGSLDNARVDDWARDVAEAIAIGQRLGEKVVVIGTSTGGTLAALAARDPELGPAIDAVVLVSPNFAMQARGLFLLRQPLARHWLPLIAGRERCFEPRNDAHRDYWTSCYPPTAALSMAAMVAEARRADYSTATQPLLALFSDADRIVDPQATEAVLQGWGGPVTRVAVTLGPGDDPGSHVIAGDILSPGQTAPLATRINGWMTQIFGE